MNANQMKTIETITQSARLNRYYASNYQRAAASRKLDGRMFATIAEQQAFFSRRAAQASKSLRADLLDLRGLFVAQLRAAKNNIDEQEIIKAQIDAITSELKPAP